MLQTYVSLRVCPGPCKRYGILGGVQMGGGSHQSPAENGLQRQGPDLVSESRVFYNELLA